MIDTKRRIKLLCVLPDLRAGGAQRVVSILLSYLPREQFQISLALVQKKGPFIDQIPSDVEIIDFDCSRRRFALLPLLKEIRRRKPELIFSTLFSINVIVLLANFLANLLMRSKIPVVIREANTLSLITKRRFLRSLIKKFYPLANRIVCLSPSMREELRSVLSTAESKLLVIPNPVLLHRKSVLLYENSTLLRGPKFMSDTATNDNLSIGNPRFVAVGKLTKQKGFDILIQSFAYLLECFPEAQLSIIGNGREESELRSLANSLCIDKHVHFLGYVNNPSRYFECFQALILSSRYEGMPNVVLEAFAEGLPVIASDLPELHGLLQPGINGFLFESENPRALFQTMKTFLETGLQQLSKDTIKNCVTRFGAEHIAKEYQRMFLDVVEP